MMFCCIVKRTFLMSKGVKDMPTLLSVDLDGTLFNNEAKPTQKNLEAITLALKNGVHVIINSGRPIQEIKLYPELLALNIPVFCHNGSQIYNEKLECLKEYTISLEDVKEAIEKTKHLHFGARLQTDQGEFRDDEIFTLKNVKAYKLIFTTKENKEYLHEVEHFMDTNKFNFAVESHKNKIEITNKQASKGIAIREFQTLTGVTYDRICTIGDGENDIPHFQAATISVAMNNATDDIKQHADHITMSNIEDGVAYAIEHIFKLI